MPYAAHRLLTLAACAILLIMASSERSVAQVYNPANGHYYQRVDVPLILWPDAKNAAAGMVYAGMAGHLATITSQAENDFIVDNLGGAAAMTGHWLGGYQDHSAPNYSEPAGGWRWITGETWSYTNWADGEPNNLGGEDYLEFASFAGSPHDKWNDYLNAFEQHGFIVEFETPWLLVVDSANSRIMKLDGITGQTVGDFIVPAGPGHVFESIAFGPDDNLYVADWLTGSVHRYNGNTGADMGLFIPSGSGGLSNPDQLAFGPDGGLYVSDRFQGRIYSYSTNGVSLGMLIYDPRLIGFIGFTIGPDGNIYAGTFNGARQILRYSGVTGAFMGVFYEDNAANGAFAGMTFGPDGDLYAARYHRAEVVRLDGSTGQLKQVYTCPGQTRADYVTIGPDGLLYVTTLDDNVVVRYDPSTGACLGAFGSVPSSTGITFMVPFVRPAQLVRTAVFSVRKSLDRYGVTFRLINGGTSRIESVKVLAATLGSAQASSQLPMSIKGDIPTRGWVDVFIAFPKSAGARGEQVTFTVNGSFGGGSFSHTQLVTLP